MEEISKYKKMFNNRRKTINDDTEYINWFENELELLFLSRTKMQEAFWELSCRKEITLTISGEEVKTSPERDGQGFSYSSDYSGDSREIKAALVEQGYLLETGD